MLAQRLMWIIWPAFLVAGLFEVLVFGLVDPEDLHWFGNTMAMSRQGVYTVAFFLFWFLNLCIILKSISSSDIHYENGKILYINGITFSKGKYKVDIDIYKNIDS